jgi:hypothetical protein
VRRPKGLRTRNKGRPDRGTGSAAPPRALSSYLPQQTDHPWHAEGRARGDRASICGECAMKRTKSAAQVYDFKALPVEPSRSGFAGIGVRFEAY